ncbi:MAG: UDP-N-acetylmuramate dehydrogenase [Clostridiales bacterium]|nr:UDP-N-acetylmuramate dehydrogenase [Clostridiales bacterium]
MAATLDIRRDVILKPYTTMKCGGPAVFFAEPDSADEVGEAFGFAAKEGIPVQVLGAGSNVLISDKGFDGLVIKIGRNMSAIDTVIRDGVGVISCQAGSTLASFGAECLKEGLAGAEFCCGIPGNVGGAVYMNAGAYGRQMEDIVTEVTYWKDGDIKTVKGSDAGFGYRTSIFENMEDAVILGMTCEVPEGDKEQIKAYAEELRQKRVNSQPLNLPSAGSTFKRPEGYYAGKLIEDAGLKGFGLDDSGAMVSEKHAGFVVNSKGSASASDVYRLIRYIQDKVFETSGVRLEPEVRLIGDFS